METTKVQKLSEVFLLKHFYYFYNKKLYLHSKKWNCPFKLSYKKPGVFH